MSGSITIPVVYTEDALVVQPDDFNEMVTFFQNQIAALETRVAALEALHP